ncbi:hypothetical protein CUR178_05205 [Leishmania enriettii]|uniref:Protein kinase domain-containing protein n=1 Tax=Leishmania enriettii TaxID=5663 RepID=A0A836KKC9_LEIEN|nr:hypothetical protein CUR178_05205 [Leishmania enriettii]
MGEANQFSGLVARSQVTFPRVENSLTATPLAPPPLSATGGQRPASHAHEEHLRDPHPSFTGPMNQRFAQEGHGPVVIGQSVDTTPILLLYLDRILTAATSAEKQSHINKHQCALAVRRLRLIAATLRQMPQPAPSQELLTAMQSLCLLLRQCAHGSVVMACKEESSTALQVLYGPDNDPLGPAQCWPVLLCQHFTSQLLFQGAYRRLWAAWSMYSPRELEREDNVAESLDRAEDAQVMIELLFPMGVPGGEGDHPSSEDAHGVSRHTRDMLGYYQRRKMSPWRILHQDLIPTGQLVPGLGQPRSASSLIPEAARQHAVDESIRFRVAPHVYRYNGVPVVVKTLCGAEGTGDAETQEAAMQHAAEFVLDAGCRVTWCHPNIVTCLGGYTERFVDKEGSEAPAGPGGVTVAAEDHGNLTAGDVEASETAAAEERAASAAVANLPWQRAAWTVTGKPIITLGYVLELQSTSRPLTSADSVQAPCVTLHDLLFASPSSVAPPSTSLPIVGRHHFTLHEALDICAQVASALQHIMGDSREVSEAVRTAWLTVDPANIFVVRVLELNGSEVSVHPQQKQPQGSGGEEQHATETTLRMSANNESSVFAPSIISLTEGGSCAEAPVVGHPDLERGHESAWAAASGKVDPSLHSQVDTAHAPSNLEAEVCVGQGSSSDHGSAEDALRSRSKHFVVRYSPPCRWTPHEVAGSRWRPHARATSPASYVVVQLFLALLTGQVPYAHIKTDREVEERVFAGSKQPGSTADTASRRSEAAAEAQVKPSSSGQGYRIPSSLPPVVANWCRGALSLDRSQPSMELEGLRDALTAIQVSLPSHVRHSHMRIGDEAVKRDSVAGGAVGSAYEEMQSRVHDAKTDALR